MGSECDSVSKALPDESAAVERCVDGRGFDDFIRRQYRELVQFLYGKLATRQDAEDAAQESLARLLRYRDSEPALAWQPLLYRIAINVAHDQRRKDTTHHRGEHVELGDRELAAPGRSPEEQAVHRQQVMLLRQAIRELPPKCQRVYLLRQSQGMSHAQIAQCCGISVKMVEKHLAAAMRLLRQKVGDSAAGTSA